VSVIFIEIVIDSKMDWVDRSEIDLELPKLEKVLATIATNHSKIIAKATFLIATNLDFS
jgi:hypothetical protein